LGGFSHFGRIKSLLVCAAVTGKLGKGEKNSSHHGNEVSQGAHGGRVKWLFGFGDLKTSENKWFFDSGPNQIYNLYADQTID
jgi:hypothetical protein